VYATDVWTGAALSAIESAATQSKSLFLYLAYNAIHTIITLPAEMTAAADPEYGALISRIDAGDYTDERRLAAGALLVVDRSLQTVAASLQRSGEWDDTLLVFASDNGGLTGSGGSNYPLRGEMLTYFEGGVRVPAFLYAGANLAHLRMTAGTTYDGLVHASDVAPTLIGAAFAPTGDIDLGFYGLDLHRRVLAGDAAAPARRSLFYGAALAAGFGDIDLGGAKTPVLAAVRDEQHKLITNAAYCDAADTDSTVSCACDDHRTFLFDLAADPEENDDVSADRPDVVEALLKTLKANIGALVPATGAQNVNEADDALAAATAAAVAAGDSKLFLAPWRTEMVDYAADSFTTLALEDAQRVRRCPPVDFVFLLSLVGSIRRPRTRPRPPRSRASACRSTWSRCARTPRRSSKLGAGSSPPPYKALELRPSGLRTALPGSRHCQWAGPARPTPLT
jgi:arylsulfatase A-like enzyme